MAPTQKYLSGSTVCSVDGCNRPVAARGFCQGHYKRFLKNGEAGEPTFAIRAPEAAYLHNRWLRPSSSGARLVQGALQPMAE